MRALQITALTGPDGVRLVEIAEPSADSPVIIDVAAVGVAFPDLLLSRGEYQIKPEPPFTLGVEAAGRVLQAPAGSGLQVGQRVAAFGLGMAAERVAAVPELVVPIPDALTDAQGAGLVLNYHTAHLALIRRGGLTAGSTVLIHGAAGGRGDRRDPGRQGRGSNGDRGGVVRRQGGGRAARGRG